MKNHIRFLAAIFLLLLTYGCATKPVKHDVFNPQRTIHISGIAGAMSTSSAPKEGRYTFTLEDKEAIWWAGISPDMAPGEKLLVKWRAPDGGLFYTDEINTTNFFNSRSRYITSRLKIKNNITEKLQGEWRAEVYDGENNLIDTKTFIIGSAAPEKMLDIKPEVAQEIGLSEADVLIINDIKDVVIEPDGSGRTHIARKMKIITEEAKNYADIFIPYYADLDRVVVNKAYTVLKNGKTVNATQQANVTPGAESYADYSGNVFLMFTMPAVEKGAIIEYDVDIYNIIPRIKDEFFYEEIFTTPFSCLEKTFSISIPADKDALVKYYNNAPQPKVELLERGKVKKYTWNFKNLKGIKLEEHPPPLRKIFPWMVASSVKDWARVNEIVNGIFTKSIENSNQVKEAAKKLSKNSASKAEILARTYSFMQNNIRYAVLKFGNTVYSPHPADEVYKNKIGDCKDQAMLLVGLLRNNGIAAYPALARSLSEGDVTADAPALSEFDHVIVLADVDGKQIWLDPTVRFLKLGQLAPDYENVQAFVIGPKEKAGFVATAAQEIPYTDVATNKIKIIDEFQAEGELILTYYTQLDLILRSSLSAISSPEDKDKFIRTVIDSMLPQAEVLEYSASDIYDVNTPLTIKVKYRARDRLIKFSDRLLLSPCEGYFSKPFDIVSPKRYYPIFSPYRFKQKYTVLVELPADYKAVSIPQGGIFTCALSTYTIGYINKGEQIQIEIIFDQRQGTVDTPEYDKIKNVYEEFDKATKEKIVIARIKDAPSVAAISVKDVIKMAKNEINKKGMNASDSVINIKKDGRRWSVNFRPKLAQSAKGSTYIYLEETKENELALVDVAKK